MSFILSSDTSCDIFRNEMKERKIYYRPLVFTIDDVPYFDEFTEDKEYSEFYAKVRAGKTPTTSQINVTEHEEYFESILEKEEGDLVHLTLSSGLSNTYQSACTAAETVNAKYGKKRVYVVDSLGATVVQRIVVDEAEKYRDAGMSAEEACVRLADFIKHVHVYFMTLDLMALKRGGRVSGAAAFFGTVLNIKPVLVINKTGGLTVVAKKKGSRNGMEYMLDMFKEYSAECTKNARIYVPDGESPCSHELVSKLKELRPDCDVQMGWVGPVIGAHTGEITGICWLSDRERFID